MAKNYFDFARIFTDETIKDNIQYRGTSYPSKVVTINKDALLTTTVATNEIYRSDKIAHRLYNDSSLFWLIDHANNFKHGFKEYYRGAKIFYISPNDLSDKLK